MKPYDIGDLVGTTREGIAEREFYLLIDYDPCLRLMFGGEKSEMRCKKLLSDFRREILLLVRPHEPTADNR